MYYVNNTYYYKLWDARYQEYTNYFYSDKELINYIAKYYDYSYFYINDDKCKKTIYNKFINHCACSSKDIGDKYYQIFDNYDRVINVHDFEDLAYAKWISGGCRIYYHSPWGRKAFRKHSHLRWCSQKNNYIFRSTPVPYTGKIRGGSRWSPPHTAGIKRMWANPDYKGFNRGTLHGVPDWWDDRYRRVQKSWKEQSKKRHQWQK